MFSSYNPYHTSYLHQPSPYSSPYARALAEQRARALAEERRAQAQRARRYLPTEYDDDDSDEDNYGYGYRPALTPRERAYIEERRRAEERARQEKELVRARLAEEERRRREAEAEVERMRRQMFTKRRDDVNPAPRAQSTPRAQSASRPPPVPTARARSHSPPAPTTPSPSQHPTSPPTDREIAAAATIQAAYRTHRALRQIALIDAQFASLKAAFAPPATIDFVDPNAPTPTIISIMRLQPKSHSHSTGEPKLAYTPTNAPLHAYAEALSRLLVRLDGIPSRGVRAVRTKRRAVVTAIEDEAAALEALWRGVWESAAAAQLDNGDVEGEQNEVGNEEKVTQELADQEGDTVIDDDETPPAVPDVEMTTGDNDNNDAKQHEAETSAELANTDANSDIDPAVLDAAMGTTAESSRVESDPEPLLQAGLNPDPTCAEPDSSLPSERLNVPPGDVPMVVVRAREDESFREPELERNFGMGLEGPAETDSAGLAGDFVVV